MLRWCFSFVAFLVALAAPMASGQAPGAVVTASSFAVSDKPVGAIDHDRFSTNAGAVWRGDPGESRWWWQIRFDRPTVVGAILQVVGDHPYVLRNAPRVSVWQGSAEGERWFDLGATAVADEMRLYRLHRLSEAVTVRFLRLNITAATGSSPVLREVEFYADPQARVSFPDWVVAVNTTHDSTLPGHGQEFIPLAKACKGWEQLQAQQVWLGSFDRVFVDTEPRPLCAFLSGNFKDWCEVNREWWRGTQEVLKHKSLPLWASCGGAQGLAILAETGVDRPWDCPHCRDPKNPKTPIYGHIGHTAQRACGDYSGCVFERGPHWVRSLGDDPVFRGLNREFQVMESHCGQIEWAPRGWSLIATAGPGTQTKTQCLRMDDGCIYAAQFHIEMAGTPEASRRIMSNFLTLAKAWAKRNPGEKSRPRPSEPK